ncbi:MAG: ribosome maturation factor RimM [Pseudomonadales bacterium]|nr:ribosome maturation factor RimM [Pseudomonadales bacterium]
MTENRIKVGRILAPYGIKGWVKIYSYTDPLEQIFSYQPWFIAKTGSRKAPVEAGVVTGKVHAKGLIAQFEGVTDRDQALLLGGQDIWIDEASMPPLEDGEFYWYQLEQLAVFNEAGQRFGKVDRMMETGANDVLVVKPDADSIDDRERLIPWIEGTYVLDVDLDKGCIQVAWDADY